MAAGRLGPSSLIYRWDKKPPAVPLANPLPTSNYIIVTCHGAADTKI